MIHSKFFIHFFRIFLLIFSFSFLFIFSAYSYANTINSDLSQSFFRLHILANSDSKEDQELKYLVRDRLISYMNKLCQNLSSKEEALAVASAHLSDFKRLAQETVQQNGFSYPVRVEIGNFPFPTKNYGNLSLPAGYYDALKISIGSAKGQNWWCVMFPPLCFVSPATGVIEEENLEQIKANLSEEEFSLITTEEDSSSSISFKFKIVELMKNVDQFLFDSED